MNIIANASGWKNVHHEQGRNVRGELRIPYITWVDSVVIPTIWRRISRRHVAVGIRHMGIVQGSGLGPTLYIVMESDLKTISKINILFKCGMTITC